VSTKEFLCCSLGDVLFREKVMFGDVEVYSLSRGLNLQGRDYDLREICIN
jgi:hypothetical protein